MSHFRDWQVKWLVSGRQFSLGSWHPSSAVIRAPTPCSTVLVALQWFCAHGRTEDAHTEVSAVELWEECRGVTIPYQFECNSCIADMQEDKAQRHREIWSLANYKGSKCKGGNIVKDRYRYRWYRCISPFILDPLLSKYYNFLFKGG